MKRERYWIFCLYRERDRVGMVNQLFLSFLSTEGNRTDGASEVVDQEFETLSTRVGWQRDARSEQRAVFGVAELAHDRRRLAVRVDRRRRQRRVLALSFRFRRDQRRHFCSEAGVERESVVVGIDFFLLVETFFSYLLFVFAYFFKKEIVI